MTHSELVEIGYKWLLKRCSFAFKELKTMNGTGEIPDLIGYNFEGTFLIEAKTSRADFLCDQNKPFRKYPKYGLGDWRFYITPEGLINVMELPPMWGLIEVNERGKAKQVFNPYTDKPNSNIYSSWNRFEKNNEGEKAMLISALRRLHQKKVIDLIYEKP